MKVKYPFFLTKLYSLLEIVAHGKVYSFGPVETRHLGID